jgi:selenocysteine-specific elongation factor
VEVAEVPRGSTIVTDRAWRPTSRVRAEVTLVADAMAEIRPRTWFRLHVGTTEVGARIVARETSSHAPFAARVVLDEPLLLRAGDRFVVRTSAPLNTIAGGVVIDPYPSRRARPLPVGLSDQERLERILIEAGADGIESADLPVRLGLPPLACRELVRDASTMAVPAGERLVLRHVVTQVADRLIAEVEAYHREYPLDAGMPVQLLRSRVGGTPEVVNGALETAVAESRIVSRGGVAALAGWSPTPTAAQATLLQTLVSQLEASGAEPPSVEELSKDLAADPSAALRYLERRGDVVQVEQNRYYAATQLKLLLNRLREAMSGGGEINPSQLRDTLGLSRKYLIPLLEYCDRVGHTARTASGRVWRGT